MVWTEHKRKKIKETGWWCIFRERESLFAYFVKKKLKSKQMSIRNKVT